MQIVEMELRRFFTDNFGQYRFPNGIFFSYFENGNLFISCEIPEVVIPKTDISVDIESTLDSLKDFIYEFLITELEDIETITPQIMMKRFLVGRSDLVCYLDEDFEYFLSFRRRGDILQATDHKENMHEVPQYVKTPKEIIVYTQQYYDKLIPV
jgi:hypothetical protein